MVPGAAMVLAGFRLSTNGFEHSQVQRNAIACRPLVIAKRLE